MPRVSWSVWWFRVIPPFFMAAVILASPVANTRMPQASARPTLELPAAGPAATGPFPLRVMSVVHGNSDGGRLQRKPVAGKGPGSEDGRWEGPGGVAMANGVKHNAGGVAD